MRLAAIEIGIGPWSFDAGVLGGVVVVAIIAVVAYSLLND